jgi:hypothetical protein
MAHVDTGVSSFSAKARRAGRSLALQRQWQSRDRAGRVALVGLSALLAGAIAVRVWLVLDYGPAFVGFPDSHEYVTAAALGVFHDVQKPAGYPIFLVLAHLLSQNLAFTILVQHALGLATGLLLYKAVRRTGAPAWLGLLPAAVVFFGGTGLLLEHSLLGDSLFAFLEAVGIYAAVHALFDRGLRWALLAGVAVGASFWVKTVGLSGAVLLAPLLLAGAAGTMRERVLKAAAAGGVALVLIFGYAAVQAQVTGYWGYERQGAWNLYGRVATFVNCSRFTPPSGTRFLCPTQALGERLPPAFYQYARSTPAVRRFGGPATAPGSANALLQRFSVAAIEHEPIAYAGAIVHGLSYVAFPRSGEGYTPESIREALLEPAGVRAIQASLASYYPHTRGYTGGPSAIHALAGYESHTRVQGPLLIVLLLAAVLGAPLAPGRARWAAALFTLTAILSATLAVAGNSYDARYAYPAFGPLAAGAALGAWGIATRVRRGRRADSPRLRAPIPLGRADAR